MHIIAQYPLLIIAEMFYSLLLTVTREIYINIYIYIYIHIYKYVCVCVCVCVRARVCVCVCVTCSVEMSANLISRKHRINIAR